MAGSLINRLVLRSGVASAFDKTQFYDTLRLLPLAPPLGAVTTIQRPGLIGFKLNGTLRWLIDVKRFAGNPTLVIDPTTQDGLRIELRNARFPGTQLPADFDCVLRPKGFLGTPIDIVFALGGFHGQAIFERWLAGQQLLQSSVILDSDVCPLGATAKLAVAGDDEARFFPDWLFTMGGSKLATLSGLGPDIQSDQFSLKLLFPGDPSLSSQPKSRRTLLGLMAGSAVWHLKPELLNLSIGTLTAANGLFDRIDIETGESPASDVARVLVASSTRMDGLSLRVVGVTNLDGGAFDLTLALPSYAIAFDDTPESPAWK